MSHEIELNEMEKQLIELEQEEENRESEELPKLSKVMKYLEHIRPYRIIQLFAGVGAGKNYWVGQLIKVGFRVLLITSRKATANAQSAKLKTGRWIDLKEIMKAGDSWGENKYSNVITTNAHLAEYVTEKYKAEDESTHLWNYFDFIVLDEAHSMSMDAVFSDAPFYVECFLKKSYRANPNVKVVLMTGTPRPVEWLLPNEEKHDDFINLNFFRACHHVVPERVVFDLMENVEIRMMARYNEGHRIIYFANHIRTLKNIVDKLMARGVPLEEIFVSYGKEDAKVVFPNELAEKMKTMQAYLEEHERLPDGVRFFLTTTKNKEGINILNEDVKVMFAESHTQCELIQMAGRVRHGLQYLCVLKNAPQHPGFDHLFDAEISYKSLEMVRKNWRRFVETYGEQAAIQGIEKRFGCLRYNILDEKMYRYRGKKEALQLIAREQEEFEEYIQNWFDPYFVQRDDCFYSGRILLQEWFPESNLSMYDQVEDVEANVISWVNTYLEQHDFVDVGLDKEARAKILCGVNDILRPYLKELGLRKIYTDLSPALKKISHYEIRRVGETAKDIYRISCKEK